MEQTLNTIITVIVPTVLTGIGTVFMFFAKRGLLDRFFAPKTGNRKMLKIQKDVLINHKLFSTLRKALVIDVRSEKLRYKHRVNSTIYLSLFSDLLTTIFEQTKEYVEKLPEEKSKAEVLNDILMLSNSFSLLTHTKHNGRKIPDEIIRKYDVFSILHSNVFFSASESIIHAATDYYEEIDDYLDMLWVLTNWLVDEAKQKHLVFNGDIERMIDDNLLKSIDLRDFYTQN